jgi:hypothetical protein
MAAPAPRENAGIVSCGEHKLAISFEIKAAAAAAAAGADARDTLLISAVSTTTEDAEFEGRVVADGVLITRDRLTGIISSLREGRGFRLEALADNAQGFRLSFLGAMCLLRPKAIAAASDAQVARLQAKIALLTATVLRMLHSAILAEDAPSGTSPGTSAVNVWFRRSLNKVVCSTIPGLEIRDGGISLPRGTYRIEASVPAYYCDQYTSRLVSSREH